VQCSGVVFLCAFGARNWREIMGHGARCPVNYRPSKQGARPETHRPYHGLRLRPPPASSKAGSKRGPPWRRPYAPRGAPPKKNNKTKGEPVGCFCVGLRFFGLFCKNLLLVARHFGLKAAPPPPQKQNSEHTRGELNGLVVYGDVRIGLTLCRSSCSTRYELNLLLGRRRKMSVGKK
jgi:hypothetical protein